MIPEFSPVRLESVVKVARDTYVLSYLDPASARQIKPGHFCMLSPEPHTSDVFLPRPFSYYRVHENGLIEILFRVIGKATRWMASLKPGETVGVFSPLGKTFTLESGAENAILIGGGIGLPPMVLLAENLLRLEKPPSIDLIYGEREGALVVDIAGILPDSVRVHVCTEDGAVGHEGRVTDVFKEIKNECEGKPAVYSCGPNPMMAALTSLITRRSVALFEVSTEENMACGMGICKGCAIPVQHEGEGMAYKDCCKDGPVFNGFEVRWPLY